MELILLAIASLVFIATGSMTLIGMTLHDLRKIRLDIWLRRHPSVRFRSRPLVSIVVDGQPSDDCVESVWNSDYQKIELLSSGQPTRGKLLLLLPTTDTILGRTTISYAVRTLNDSSSLPIVELLPILSPPRTLGQFFHLYRHIAAAPFVMSRAGLGIIAPCPLWPTMMRPGQTINRRTYVYATGRWLVQVANLLTLLFACYLAIVLAQPALFIAYLFVLGIWMALAIAQYPHLSLRQRAAYLLLSPVAFSYFVFLCIQTSLAPPLRQIKQRSFATLWKLPYRSLV